MKKDEETLPQSSCCVWMLQLLEIPQTIQQNPPAQKHLHQILTNLQTEQNLTPLQIENFNRQIAAWESI